MTPIVDPRHGDIEDDASSPKQRSLPRLAGSLLAEISLPKLIVTWTLLVGLPGLLLGAAPPLVSLWLAVVVSKATDIFTEIWPVFLLPPLLALGWFGGRRLLRLAESSFWSLNALAVQPAYAAFREGLRHLAEALLMPWLNETHRTVLRAATAAASGVVMFAVGAGLIALTVPATRWLGTPADLASPLRLIPALLANAVVLICGYFAIAALIWGAADALMPQPRDVSAFAPPIPGARQWRIAHLSDLHTVGERYGFRIESGRSGPRGNDLLRATLKRLDEVHAAHPLDIVLITGDMTDAGRSAEWAEFFDALAAFPRLAERVVALPGNHDLNVVDRASPARMDFPTSPTKRLRQLRTISALAALQGDRLRTVARDGRRLGDMLAEALAPHAADMAAFADTGSGRAWRALLTLWASIFPMVLPPDSDDGLGVIVLNSNAETHFSFTNALGLVPAEQVRGIRIVTDLYPDAHWIVALHHHVVEYPRRAKALSERIGTALINGSWFIRQMQRLAGRVIIMHGHRHIDWIGACGGLLIVSAPSPVMGAADRQGMYFYVHTVGIARDGGLVLTSPERIEVPGRSRLSIEPAN